jgi:hypothetical protein
MRVRERRDAVDQHTGLTTQLAPEANRQLAQ